MTLLAPVLGHDPEAIAVVGPLETMTYGELCARAGQIAAALTELGIKPGDRVAIWAEKSARTVAGILGTLAAGAVYVPIDPLSPAARAALICHDCKVAAVITSAVRAVALCEKDLPSLGVIAVDSAAGSSRTITWSGLGSFAAPARSVAAAEDLAYILYTSGTTGTPKGAAISHRAAVAFVSWAGATIDLGPGDRVSSHAPFHFDLSTFDLFATLRAGGTVYLLPDSLAYAPTRLTGFIHDHEISVWYSVPSALTLMMDRGGFLDRPPPESLRVVLFAGEVFPILDLHRLRRHLPRARFLNLYGPTETNVCTYYEVTAADDDRDRPVPIGKPCCGDRVWIMDEAGNPAPDGAEGELYVDGPTKMEGYFGKEPLGDAPYRTGDIVRRLPDGDLEYAGRSDDMLKVRGHRIEPGEIESALMAHPRIAAAAVVCVGKGREAVLWAVVVTAAPPPPSLIAIKHHLADRLPRSMIVDNVLHVQELPRTRNGKVDRRSLIDLINARTNITTAQEASRG